MTNKEYKMLVDRWLTLLDETDNKKKDFIVGNVNHIKKEMRHFLKKLERKEKQDE